MRQGDIFPDNPLLVAPLNMDAGVAPGGSDGAWIETGKDQEATSNNEHETCNSGLHTNVNNMDYKPESNMDNVNLQDVDVEISG